jgi:hypothetical protein
MLKRVKRHAPPTGPTLRISAQPHSLGKVGRRAAAAVDADDDGDIELMVCNQPGQFFTAFECRRNGTRFGKVEEIALEDGARGWRVRDEHFRRVTAGERIEDDLRAAKIERARRRYLLDCRVGHARKLPA